MWGDQYFGYVKLFLPWQVSVDDMIADVPGLELFRYDGRTGETDNIEIDSDTVKDTWEHVVGDDSFGFAGATASLGGYELMTTFGVV